MKIDTPKIKWFFDACAKECVGRYGQMDRRTNLLENLLSHMDTDVPSEELKLRLWSSSLFQHQGWPTAQAPTPPVHQLQQVTDVDTGLSLVEPHWGGGKMAIIYSQSGESEADT
eukprot:scaffold659_cov71-Cylindrotheca_fusiformis.AAC.1